MSTLEVGQQLAEWSLAMTPTTIVSTAIATRDWQDVHHDRDVAQAAGSQDIFMNILTSNGLVEKFVVDALGKDTELKGISIRLGAAAYPYDTLTFTGTVSDIADGVASIDVVGRVSTGDHVTGTVKVLVP
jgi:acyl dehydratase